MSGSVLLLQHISIVNSVSLLQYLGCIYLVYRNYWIFPLLLALLSLAANLALVFTLRLRHTTTLGLIGLRRIIPIVQQGWVKALPAYKLVPGDVIVVQAGKVSCDMVLLRGSCLVEEAMLSGEVWRLTTFLSAGCLQDDTVTGCVLSTLLQTHVTCLPV